MHTPQVLNKTNFALQPAHSPSFCRANSMVTHSGWLNCAAVHTSDGLPDSDKDTPFTVRDPVFGNSRVLNRAPIEVFALVELLTTKLLSCLGIDDSTDSH